MTTQQLPFWLVDVFAHEPLSGNSLSVFLLNDDLPKRVMQSITHEMRQFETIFVRRMDNTAKFHARIFTMEEELPFAGHPVIGAAAVLHSNFFFTENEVLLEFVIHDRSVKLTSRRQGESYIAEMDQGDAIVGRPIPPENNEVILSALNLSISDLAHKLPLQVVSTGLPYLIVPIISNLEHARIVAPDFEALLAIVGAKFVYVLEINAREGRTWDNSGNVEDIATGSAAGPAAVYLVTHECAPLNDTFALAQGRFLQRPSELYATVQGSSVLNVIIAGKVCFVGSGRLMLPNKYG